METSSSNSFDSSIAIESNIIPSRSPRCNEQARSLNFKLSTTLDSPQVTGRKTNDGMLYDCEKLKSELLLKADEFFNTGCIKIEPLKNELSIEQVLLRQSDELAADAAYAQAEDVDVNTKKCEKGVTINIDGEFEILLEHIEGLNTPEIASDMLGLKLCSNFDSSSKAIVVSSLETLAKILSMPAFDPHAPPVKFKIKRALALHELSHREDNAIIIDIPMESVDKYMESKEFNPFNECLNIFVKHEKDEFCTFCSCPECLSYREVVVHMMMEQFKGSHMVVLLLEALLKAYSPLLKNKFAFKHFVNLLERHKDIYWLASGLIYNKKYEELDFIYDESLTDPTILVLFSSILMINSPMELLQILIFYMRCVVEAFALGIADVAEEEKLTYILDGFDHLSVISDQIASYFVIFERNFLSKFSLTWLWLCQRLFHQHVYVRFLVGITNCGEVLKRDESLRLRHAEFVRRMRFLDMFWAKTIWPKLQKYNLTESEAKRRDAMIVIHKLFESLIEDALRLPIHNGNDDNLFEDINSLKDRRVLWKNILSFAKMQWPDGFFPVPNTLIFDTRCQQCGSVSTEHERGCKCITCAIGGTPFDPNNVNLCRVCGTHGGKNGAEAKDETESVVENKSAEDQNTNVEKCQREVKKTIPGNAPNAIQDDFREIRPADVYHISWAVFKHFTQRKLYVRDKIEERYFCRDCKFPACMLARRLLNNEMAPTLTKILMSHFNPLPMLQSDLHGIFPVVFYFNPRMFASHHESSLHNTVVKGYWTFIVSVFGTFFVDVEKPCPLNLDALEIDQYDVRVVADKLRGNKDDGIFLEFLDTIRSSSSAADGGAAGQSMDPELVGRKKLDEFFKPTKKGFCGKNLLRISTESIKMPSTAIDTGDNTVTVQPTSSNSLPGVGGCDAMEQKRSCTPKSKKCCLEHATDFVADHCKESHANRKRLKKDCSHVRVNETRDRLRKKLQDVRKSQQQMPQTQNPQPPQSQPQQQQQQLQQTKVPQKMHNESSEVSSVDEPPSKNVAVTRKLPPMSPTTTPVSGSNTPQSVENVDDSEQVIGKVMEICDMLDNNKQKMKKWLDETLTYIEGYASSTTPTSATNAKKTQPQTKDPKKAAKKAKQKLRRDEEKRIAELHEVRDQFQDVYFKEFLEKIELKTLKKGGVIGGGGNGGGNIKRRCDKKKIADVEANIKKLQRAKAKLESNILELIATVKQTNTEFKFPYLPTKEQQQAKLHELAEGANLSASSEDAALASQMAQSAPPAAGTPPEDVAAPGGYMPPFQKFYPNISFPYEMSFPVGTAAPPPPYGTTNQQALPTACYSPPQQQALSPNVMAALAANENSVENSTADPSKRIVTIRRVHNPDMPDSQVTVTARGGTHGSEKLLYTFVNGTMVPTTGPAANSDDPQQVNYEQLEITTADGQPLSKSQLKKERRRLAKLLSLAQDLAISDCEEDEMPLTPPTQVKSPNVKSATDTKEPKLKKQRMLTKGFSEDSTSSSQSIKKAVQEKSVTARAKENKPSAKPSSSSLEAAASTTATSKKNYSKTELKQKKTEIKSHTKLSRKQEFYSKQESSDDSDASPMPAVVQRTVRQTKSQPKIANEQQKSQKAMKSRIDEPPPPPPQQEVESEAVKQHRQRRLKLANLGQFDNNPYKNLHMQDSDSELDVTASSCDEEGEVEPVSVPAPAVVPAVKEPLDEPPKKDKTKPAKQKSTATQVVIKSASFSPGAAVPNRSRATQTPSMARVEDAPKTQRAPKPQQQNKRETGPMKRQLDQSKGKAAANAQSTFNERRRTDFAASSSNKQTSLNQNSTPQRLSKKQDASTSTPRNAPAKGNARENERAKAAKDHSLNDDKSTMSSSKRRSGRKKPQPMQQAQQHQIGHHNYVNYTDCGAGIPMRMEYFNPNEVNIPPPLHRAANSYQPQQMHYDNLTRQFQGMRVATQTAGATSAQPSYASISATTANVSIMDQLNRGVQVENLALPPGITLTKVDPAKSEQLRLKSESIKRLSQPLQAPTNSMPGNYSLHGSTIIAPPTAGYLTASAASAAAPGSSIIMVEGMAPKPPAPSSAAIAAAAAAATATGKASSKSKRRRNKGKRTESDARDSVSTNASSNNDQQQTKMVTLRNPMFHAGPAAAAASILQQPNLIAAHHGYAGNTGGLPMAPPCAPDQPAAIIKNENGMFTIRNPALHQAVTNGLALGGYRQFGGNVSYYTPQEAVAEAAKAQQQQQQQTQQSSQRHANVALPTESYFSYFSNNGPSKPLQPELISQPATKKISITCTTVDPQSSVNNGSENAVQRKENPTPSPIARPSSAQRCISAIGSEVKQNRNSANVEHLWSEYRQQPHDISQSSESLSKVTATLLGNSVSDMSGSNPQNDYFNGYEVFPQRGGNSSHLAHAPTASAVSTIARPNLAVPSSALPCSPNPLFETSVNEYRHMPLSHQHHRCGDDSPPPTNLLGYSSTYLDDIPNTGVIRYDDASFLKNLIPGQRLNKEVSIHNINESNFGRPASPMSHLIEITPVYNVGNKVGSPSPSLELQSQRHQQQLQQHYLRTPSSSSVSAAGAYSLNSLSGYQQNFNDYAFPNAGSNDNTTASSTCSAEQAYQPFGYDAFDSAAPSKARVAEQKSMNSLFPTNFTTASQRSSPYLDESFVQNLNALQISGPEQCAHQRLNGETLLGNGTNCNVTTSSASASGWW